jgi:hypothetical protein
LKEALAKRDRERAEGDGTERTLCRLCGMPLQWMVAPDGRRMPFDVLEDGSIGQNHFETCKPYLERLANREAEEVPA